MSHPPLTLTLSHHRLTNCIVVKKAYPPLALFRYPMSSFLLSPPVGPPNSLKTLLSPSTVCPPARPHSLSECEPPLISPQALDPSLLSPPYARTPPAELLEEEEGEGGEGEEDEEPIQDVRRKMQAIRAVKFQNYSLREAARAYGLTSTTLHRLVHGGKLNAKRSRPKVGGSSLSEKRALIYAMTQAAMALSALRHIKQGEDEPAHTPM